MCKKCWTITTLLALLVLGGAYKFMIQGSTVTNSDGRLSIQLSAGERDLVLQEMRGFLSSVQKIVQGAASNDANAIVTAARAVGNAAQGEVPGSLVGKLPGSFKKLGFDTHTKFDNIARDAEELEDGEHALTQLATLMQNCVACHATYRIDAILE